MKTRVTMRKALTDPKLLGSALPGSRSHPASGLPIACGLPES